MRFQPSRSASIQKLILLKGSTLLRRSAAGLILAMFVLLVATSTAKGATIIYVDASASGAGTGANWTDAYPKLQDALAAAASGDQIWVAAGVYYSDEGGGMTNDDRTATFTMINGVEVYGGFAGSETSLGQRDWVANVTVLSGDIEQNDTTDPNGVVTDVANIFGSNAYHVVTGGGTDSSAVLDGFTLTAGRANGTVNESAGGGMFNLSSSPTVTNVRFTGNIAGVGGGMYTNNSIMTLTNVSFIGNQANSAGGMSNQTSSPTLRNVSFTGNQADADGGGMSNSSSSLSLTNVTFSGNQAVQNGGAIRNFSSNPTLKHVILWDNQAGFSGNQITNSFSTPFISYSDIQGSGGSGAGWDTALGTDAGGNIDADPLFVTPVDPATAPTTAGDLHLQPGSWAVDAGDNDECPASDLDGNMRPIDGDLDGVAVCDMGAFELLIRLFLPLIQR